MSGSPRNPGDNETLRELLQQFVEARIDAPLLFARADDNLPVGCNATEEVLRLLAKSELELELPKGRGPLLRRIQQVASGETAYTELDLWFFTLTQIKAINSHTPAEKPETELLRVIVQWSQGWDDETRRPSNDLFEEFVEVLRKESDPVECQRQLEEILARDDRD